jgi:hypothetical protein
MTLRSILDVEEYTKKIFIYILKLEINLIS